MISRHTLTLALLAALSGPVLASSVASPHADARYAVLPPGVYAGNEPGLELVHDYGAFQLWRIDGAHVAELQASGSGHAVTRKDGVLFAAGSFDPLRQETLPHGFGLGKPTGAYLQVVQFVGPVAEEWLAQLRAAGATTLQYLPDNSYLLLADQRARAQLGELVRQGGALRALADLPALYKLDAPLAARARAGDLGETEIKVTVLLADHPGKGPSRAHIEQLARGASHGPWENLRGMEALTLTVRESDLSEIALLGDVVAIEKFVEPKRRDEVQAQIMRGALNPDRAGPTGPGYLAWLTGLGFSTSPADYPLVSVVDDGVGNGTATNGAGDVTLTANGDGTTTRIGFVQNCTTDATAEGIGGHGHINASIVGSFDARAGAPFLDPLGYRRGQGLNPFARLANFRFFNAAGAAQLTNCGGTQTMMIQAQYANGVRISSNSWGAAVAGAYNATARSYDIGTRDAHTVTAGNQPMIFVVAAGNDGPGAATVGSPGTAKNVITVGASENFRPSDEDGLWMDGCLTGDTGADNAMDVIPFSSRGPAAGGRAKPELIAPGTHVQGSASTSAGYNGTGVCDQYRPAAQTSFASSSGTSHSTPAIAGAASLLYRFLGTHYSLPTPSPAVIKAYFMAHPTYLSGFGANDNLPSNTQGYGMPNLGQAFDPNLSRIVADQATLLNNTGDSSTFSAVVEDDGKPLRIALAWTDAPGVTNSAAPLVNNLNLTVTVGATTYRGNVFAGAFSAAGGTADTVNNYEAVYLPAGTSGPVTITVTGANIAGDGVPTVGDATDQDFALVCSNCEQVTGFVVDAKPTTRRVCAIDGTSWSVDVLGNGGYAGTVGLSALGVPASTLASFAPPSVTLPPNGASLLSMNTSATTPGSYIMSVQGSDGVTTKSDVITMQVSGATPAAPTLSTPSNGAVGVTLRPALTWTAVAGAESYLVQIDNDADFSSPVESVQASATSHTVGSNLNANTRYYWRVVAKNACGDSLASQRSEFFTNVLTCNTFPAPGLPKAITDGGNTTSDIVVSTMPGIIQDVDILNLAGTHTWVQDLTVYALKYSGGGALEGLARVLDQTCGNVDNFSFNFDDAAAAANGSWACASPVGAGGTFKPLEPLSNHNGKSGNGTWRLFVIDNFTPDGGMLNSWSLRLCTQEAPVAVSAVDDVYAGSEDLQLNVSAAGVLANDVPNAGLTSITPTAPTSGTLVAFNADGSFSFMPAPNACGPVTFNYTATNGMQSDLGTVTINVACANDAPSATGTIADRTDAENAMVTQNTAANFTEVDGDTLAYSATGLPTGLSIDPATGIISGTLSFNAAAGSPFPVVVTATDPSNATATQSFSWTVTNTNRAPAAAGTIADRTDAEGAAVTQATAARFSDADGDTLSYSATGLPTGLSISPATGEISGTLAFTANASSPFSVSVTATDPSNATATQAFTWTVTNTNQAPAANGTIADRTDAEGAAVTQATAARFSDADGDTLSYSATGLPTGLSISPATGEISGTLAANANAGSPFSVIVTATDPSNATATQAFGWTVSNTNQAPTPVGTIADRTDAEGVAVVQATAANFSDADIGDTLAYSATGLPTGLAIDPVSGVISGSLAFTANAGSPFSVVVTATDDADATATQAFVWTVTNTNQAPTALGTIADRGDAEGAVVSQATAANFTDADAGDTLAYSATGLPSGLAIDPASGVISGTLAFTASAGSPFNVVVTATDGSDATATQAFTWSVTNTNRAPTVSNEPYAFTVTDNATVGAAVGVVSGSDADGDALTFSISGGNVGNPFGIDPATGAISVATAGVLVGGTQVTLTVRVADAGGLDDTTEVVITVLSSGPVDPFIFRNGFEGN